MLHEGELSAGALIERLGLEQANASQRLAVMRAKQIVISRKVYAQPSQDQAMLKQINRQGANP
ncbi:MAG TPA: hypothetical protein VK604_16195 [Bryobacteraceae bacterium]|nr:hypothetical protein [Bryobacteraceae bacterium]